MDRATYEVEAEVEHTHWWFRGRRRLLARLLADLSPALPPRARVLDVGCGTGANAPTLAAPGRLVIGVDPSPIALGLARDGRPAAAPDQSAGSRHHAVARADAAALPFADATFDLVVALDVLEHLDDHATAAAELHRVLRPGGALVVFVPALQILWGLQDDVSHHKRRYAKPELRALLAGAGLHISRLTYFNTLLFPPILAARLAMRIRRPNVTTENELTGPFTNRVLGAIFAAETPLLARLDLPIGVSLAAVCRRGA